MRPVKFAAPASALALVLAMISAPVFAADDPIGSGEGSGSGSAGGGVNTDNIGGSSNTNGDPIMDRKNGAGAGDLESRSEGSSRYDNSQAGVETERELRKKDGSASGSAGATTTTPEEEEAEE